MPDPSLTRPYLPDVWTLCQVDEQGIPSDSIKSALGIVDAIRGRSTTGYHNVDPKERSRWMKTSGLRLLGAISFRIHTGKPFVW